jgi:hypothetical protein
MDNVDFVVVGTDYNGIDVPSINGYGLRVHHLDLNEPRSVKKNVRYRSFVVNRKKGNYSVAAAIVVGKRIVRRMLLEIVVPEDG